ncbi:iron complex transport system substrate-binding protein [Rhodococcus sp. 27YEA15]|uniref:ABC transporter substrate-binding protein n=1 Tax=Rhodococcus sp. 27YEA15 TaxID=3156259 RepID=UPI003C7D8546
MPIAVKPAPTDLGPRTCVGGLSRRRFFVGTAAVSGLLVAGCARSTNADGASVDMRTVTSSLGTYDIPVTPKRVVAIDSRLDLEPAVAMGLPVVAYSFDAAEPWVPADPTAQVFEAPVNVEAILALEPDLIICTDIGEASDMWPLEQLSKTAPVLPMDFTRPWRENIDQLASWLERTDNSEVRQVIGGYEDKAAGLRERHAKTIASKQIILLNYVNEKVNGVNRKGISAQVAEDLGVRVLWPVEGQQEISTENLVTSLDEADGMIVTTAPGVDPVTDDRAMWNRIRSVRNDDVVYTGGNINYGSVYTATRTLDYFDDLFTRLEN